MGTQRRQKHQLLLRGFFTLFLLAGKPAHAACTNPSMPDGSLFYNAAQNVPQVCAGGNWVALGALNPAAGGGECSGPTMAEGSIFYNDDYDVLQYCDGENWIAVQAAPSACGDSTAGFFVLTQGQWNGDLVTAAGGGMSGRDAGNALCLNDLTTYDWQCKSRAQSRGLLDSTHVKAFLCDSTGCNGAVASTVYYYAYANHPTNGGNKFKTDASGIGPQEQSYWDNFYNFGDTESLWSGRGSGTNIGWLTTPVANTCTDWTDSTAGVFGRRGNTNEFGSNRWAKGDSACNNQFRLVCFVNP